MKDYKTVILTSALLCIANNAYASDEEASPSPELVIGAIMPSSVGASASVNGDIKALAAIYSWKTGHDGLYAGGGVGGALVTDEVTSIGGNSNISGKESGVVPVGTVQAGYRLSGDGDDPINIDMSYRYLYFLSGQNGLSDLTASSVFVNLSVPF